MSKPEPVPAGEYVLRRIHRNDFDSNLPIPIKRPAFQPRLDDTDGLSVYCEKVISAAALAASGRSPGAYYVSRLAVADLHALNLTVVKVPGDLPGHAVIPEMTRAAYEADKRCSKDLQLKLATLASQTIVHSPSP
jgi:hypothetical protein